MSLRKAHVEFCLRAGNECGHLLDAVCRHDTVRVGEPVHPPDAGMGADRSFYLLRMVGGTLHGGTFCQPDFYLKLLESGWITGRYHPTYSSCGRNCPVLVDLAPASRTASPGSIPLTDPSWSY
jgi:hypothetical protein